MSAKTYEVEKQVENDKNRTQTGHNLPVSGFGGTPKDTGVILFPPPLNTGEGTDKTDKTPRAGKDSQNYWKTKVKPRVIRGRKTPELYVRLFEAGREAWICCDSSNRSLAANKARDLYLRMKAIGLPALLAELRPDAKPDRVCTIGEYLAAARPFAKARPRVFDQYAAALRRVFALVLDLHGPAERFYAKGKAAAEWRAKLDGLRLDAITPQDVEKWRVAFVNAESDHAKRKARADSVSTYLRNAKGAFARKIISMVAPADKPALVRLPAPLPFAGLTAPAATRRFRPQVKALDLYNAALRDFADAPDTLCAALLLLTGGLRRGEADLLEWRNVNLAEGRITITATEFFTPKTEEGDRVIKLPPDVAELLRAYRITRPRAVFVLDGSAPKTSAKGYEYRADAWPVLIGWMRGQGVTTAAPLHSLRKHAGSLVYNAGGIEAARRFLGHKKIATTSASYLDAADLVADPTAVSVDLSTKTEGAK
jgi:integrase